MLSTCLTIPINNKGCLPYGSSSTISINTVNNTCRIRKSCFGYCNDIHLVGSSQFLEDTTIQELKTYSQKLTHMGVSFWAYTNLHCYVCNFLRLSPLLNLSFHLFASLDGELFDSTVDKLPRPFHHCSTIKKYSYGQFIPKTLFCTSDKIVQWRKPWHTITSEHNIEQELRSLACHSYFYTSVVVCRFAFRPKFVRVVSFRSRQT
ncbi:hypothetical protein T06_1742 [Trichinella sp. T6]|nr:hypothetical protein T06_1742 [Trichinella sp. T6]